MSDGVVADHVEGEKNVVTGTHVGDYYEVNLQVGPTSADRADNSGAKSRSLAKTPRTVAAQSDDAQQKPMPPPAPGRGPAAGEKPGALLQAAIFGCQVAGWSALYLGFCLARAARSGGDSWQARDILIVLFPTVIGALGFLAQRRTAASSWLPFVSLLLTILTAILLEIGRATAPF